VDIALRNHLASPSVAQVGNSSVIAASDDNGDLHMIDEYARHLGHADLLREQIDGATGE
jgi:hypothetical protein